MATRYHSFSIFMDDVLQQANKRVNLEELFELENLNVIEVISVLLSKGGWQAFLAVVALLILGPTAFILALGTFTTTPVGWVIMALFGVAAIASIKILYQNKALPLAVKEVGVEFKPRWETVEGNQEKVDTLLEEAINCLIVKARKAQRNLFEER